MTEKDLGANQVCTIMNLTHPFAARKVLQSSSSVIFYLYILPAISAFGIMGNLAFLYSLLRLPSPKGTLNLYLINQAFCDICYLVVSTVWMVMFFDKTTVSFAWPVNSAFGCASYVLTIRVWYFASLGFMTLIIVERYLAVCKPFQHMTHKRKSRTNKLILLAWCSAIVIVSINTISLASVKRICLIWPETTEFENLSTVVYTCGPLNKTANLVGQVLTNQATYFVPLIVNITLFYKILKTLSNRPVVTSASERIRNQVARMLIFNGTVFFLCHLPQRIARMDHLLDSYDLDGFTLLNKSQSDFIFKLGQGTLLLNSVINPYIYVLGSKYFRRCMKAAFCMGRSPATYTTVSRTLDPDTGTSNL